MSQGQLTFITILFVAVIAFGALMIAGAVLIRRRRLGAQRTGPGSPDASVPDDAWQRFGAALAAVYARHEWHETRGARRLVSAEQTYFGYACAHPYPMLRRSLAGNWQVRRPEQARERVRGAVDLAVSDAALIAGARGETPEHLRERLLAAGSPAGAAELAASRVPLERRAEDPGPEGLSLLAFDLVRFANLVRWCGGIGFLDRGEVRDASEALAAAAVTAFDGWDELGEHYVLGLRARAPRGDKPFVRAVEWLRTDPESPWLALAWPGGR